MTYQQCNKSTNPMMLHKSQNMYYKDPEGGNTNSLQVIKCATYLTLGKWHMLVTVGEM